MIREIYGFGHTQRKYECKSNDKISVDTIRILGQLNVYGVFLHDSHTVLRDYDMYLVHVLEFLERDMHGDTYALVARVKYVSYGLQ